jgi:hypothetical protein
VEVHNEGAGGEDSGEVGDELGGGGFTHSGDEVSHEVTSLGGECGVASGRGARKRLGKQAREEGRVGEREGEAGECVAMWWDGAEAAEERRAAAQERQTRPPAEVGSECDARWPTPHGCGGAGEVLSFHVDGKLWRSV